MLEHILQGLMYPFLFLSMYFEILLLVSFFENAKRIKDEESLVVTRYPTVTIAVPCWNEEKTIGATIESLLALDYPKDKLHITVVDNNSDDATEYVARKYVEKYKAIVSYMKETKQGKHHAVNLALAHSQSELFGCLDADSFVDHKALRIIVSYFEHCTEAMAVTPCIHIRKQATSGYPAFPMKGLAAFWQTRWDWGKPFRSSRSYFARLGTTLGLRS